MPFTSSDINHGSDQVPYHVMKIAVGGYVKAETKVRVTPMSLRYAAEIPSLRLP
ncbi:uncharacterized protein METZ01_LOCUS40346 [marine metagenome]|uniref:Uncharacterized protein n=1 Tax=marine metagenome TaxID=408172 RepID=A0A381R741_9ZZZZ